MANVFLSRVGDPLVLHEMLLALLPTPRLLLLA
jgi:hypothetical protein